MVSDSRRLSGGVSRETHETREKRSASRLSPADAPQGPGSPGGPVHDGEPARAKHGGFTGPIKFLSCLSCVSREMALGKSTV